MNAAVLSRVAPWLAFAHVGCAWVPVMLLLAGSAAADPITIMVHGGAAQPVFDESDIRMVSEDLAVQILPDKAMVHADFTFVNESAYPKEVVVGFPQIRYAQAPTAKLADMAFLVDAKPVPIALLDPDPVPTEGIAFPLPRINSWYVARLWFKNGQRVHLTVSYSHEHGGGIYGPFFEYLLATAAGWKANVEEINVRVTLGEGVPEIQNDGVIPKGYQYDAASRTVTWQFRDYAGDPHGFTVYWRRPPGPGAARH